MSTILDKLYYLKSNKLEIRKAIVTMGVSVPLDAKFRDYPKYIKQISGNSDKPLINISNSATSVDLSMRDKSILIKHTDTISISINHINIEMNGGIEIND